MESNFILQSYIKDITLCDDIIEYFEENTQYQYDGLISAAGEFTNVNKKIKDSTDCLLSHNQDLYTKYCNELQPIIEKYVEKFPYSNEYAPWRLIEEIVVQRYLPGQAFYEWHTERSNSKMPATTRHIVFMTYLNDVYDGGGTEFYHQNLVTPAKKGSTILWPADWTHTHRGQVSLTETKYIITGWLNYVG